VHSYYKQVTLNEPITTLSLPLFTGIQVQTYIHIFITTEFITISHINKN